MVGNYTLISIHEVSSEDFYNLINSNKEYIQKGFAGTVKDCQTKKSTEELFKKWISDEHKKQQYSFFIKDEIADVLIGLVNVKSIDQNIQKCEIGYFIAQVYAGKGIVSNMTSEVIRFCFEDLEMNKIFLRVFPENIGSKKVALKNGFVQEGILRQEYRGFQGELEDVMYLGLLKSTYFS